ncbi:hypothetical protein GQ651_01220 [Alphaproteobacteria bacterium GH1-50]|uniref:GP-PDE domain-containing protein n=1 Tax=Kangsaoukella pontilimi TaxID=2691042 RepID=A0A7C9MY14_9RHOB|nr:glycerophosphodiester phosphodiesterase family protein [Kangsaoukella pontilimi]MXQ06458.1 hypothetical protein [Kangsaoukella pontilimi]
MHPRDAFRQRWQARPAPALISVHRGAWGPAPENSRRAISDGAAIGIVEIDVQLAADGVPVVMHDESLARMTGDPRKVGTVPSVDIAALTLRSGGGGDGVGLSDETVPLLKEAVTGAPADAFFDFDVKFPAEIDRVAAFLAAEGLAGRGSVKVDVANAADIDALRSLEERDGLMVMAKLNLAKGQGAIVPALVEAGVAAAEVYFDDLAQLRDAADASGDRLALSTYTLDPVHCCGLSDAKALQDPDAVWGRLLHAGATILMTDRPRDLAAYLARSDA